MLGVVVARRPGALSLCLPRTFRPRGAIPPARSRASHGAPAPSPSRARAGWRRVAGSISDDRNAPQKIARSPRRVAPPARRLWPSRLRANLFFRASRTSRTGQKPELATRSRENRLSPSPSLRSPDAFARPLALASGSGRVLGTKVERCDAHAAIRRSAARTLCPATSLETTEIGEAAFPGAKGRQPESPFFQTVILDQQNNETRRDREKGLFRRGSGALRAT